MKILIIVKLDELKTKVSNNRINFLEFLNKKDNIKVLNDNFNLIEEIERLKKNEWIVDIIIYYRLHQNNKIKSISKDEFIKLNIKKYLFMEDFGTIENTIIKYNELSFDGLIIPLKNSKLELRLKENKINYYVWGFYFDTNIFKDWNLPKKYNILLYGCIYKNGYPLRHKIHYLLNKLEKNKKNKIKIIKFPGYDYDGKVPRNEDLSKLINESKFCVATRSIHNMMVKKYQEITLSNSIIIGDIPSDYEDLFKNNIVYIDRKYDYNKIMKILKKCINGKYDYLLKNNNINNLIKDKYSFEKGYEKLISFF